MALGKGVDKWKAKKWFNIYAPELLGGATIGEMPASEEKTAMGRIIKVSMSWITNKPAHSFLVVGLRVVDATGGAAHTELAYIEQTYSYIHSLVRRGNSIIYTVDKLKDKDGRNFVLKLVMTTASKITAEKKKALRKEMESFAREYAESRSVNDVVKEILEGSFHSEGVKRVKNIAEISKLELKRLQL
jgi:small subunit ribosomal protein S3Ae